MEEQLLIRFLSHQCTPDELKEVQDWISTDKAHADWLFEIERLWSLKDEFRFSDKKEIEIAFNRFMNELEKKEKAQYETKPIYTISRTTELKMDLEDTISESDTRENNLQEENISGKEYRKAVNLKISPLRRIVSLSKYAAAIFIVVLLSLNLYRITTNQNEKLNTIEVPRGQRVALTLCDGTRVWLNSDSKLTYPASFGGNKREVTLQGEGYFEVTKDHKHPFIVHNPSLDVKVLGTKFNVKAYLGEISSVFLKEGKVEVSDPEKNRKIILHPSDKVLYTLDKGFKLQTNVSSEESDSWRQGELAFVEESLRTIIKSLERRYDVQITVHPPELNNKLFTCRFKQDATLEQVLDLLKDTREFTYKIENKKVNIYSRHP